MANTCFPSEGLNGGKGHTDADVTCECSKKKPAICLLGVYDYETSPQANSAREIDIFFTGDDSVLPSSAIGKNYLTNFQALKSLGDKLMKDLVSSLHL